MDIGHLSSVDQGRGTLSMSSNWLAVGGALTGIFPLIDWIFPTATLKQYLKGQGLELRAKILGLELWFNV